MLAARQAGGVGTVGASEIGNDALGFLAHRLELAKPIKTGVKEVLQLALFRRERWRKDCQRSSCSAHSVDRRDPRFADSAPGFAEDVANHVPNHVTNQRSLLFLGR